MVLLPSHLQVYVGITIILSIFLFSYVLAILAHVSGSRKYLLTAL
jgi:hypothetical protein